MSDERLPTKSFVRLVDDVDGKIVCLFNAGIFISNKKLGLFERKMPGGGGGATMVPLFDAEEKYCSEVDEDEERELDNDGL